jgi:ribosome-associated protein
LQIARSHIRKKATHQAHQHQLAANENHHAERSPGQLTHMGAQQRQQSPKTSLRGSPHGGTVSTSSQRAPQMKLDQFLKWKGWVSTGGEAKQRIQMGEVTVNDAVEIRRGRQLSAGDRVVLAGEESVVES